MARLPTALTPTPDQQRAADPLQSVWVGANAGSGKTHVLVDRVIRLMLNGAAPDSILCLTFTRAAAAEMAARLFKRLGAWISLDDADLADELRRLGTGAVTPEHMVMARRLFAMALETPGGLKIQTIHAFAERLLQLFPVEAGLAPGFRVMDARQEAVLRRQAFLEALSKDDDVSRHVWSFLDNADITSLDALEEIAKPFFSGSSGMRQLMSDGGEVSAALAHLQQQLGVPEDVNSLSRAVTAIDAASYARAADALQAFPLFKKHPVPELLRQAADTEDAEARKDILFTLYATKDGKQRAELLLVATKKARPDLADWLAEEQERVMVGLERVALRAAFDVNHSLYVAMAGVLQRVNAEKRRRGLYDFDDLIARAAALLQDSASASWILQRLDAGLNHVLVDEAQDTSPAQWRIITALADDFFSGAGKPTKGPRTVFAVGDHKQSIYSFQGADTAAFDAAHVHFRQRLQHIQKRLVDVDLTVSYRSTATVLQAVDKVFAKGRETWRGIAPAAAAAEPRGHQPVRSGLGIVELWPIIRPREEPQIDYWRKPVDEAPQDAPRRRLARLIASAIHGWVGKRKLAGHERAVRPGDILILLQRRSTLVFPALIAELRRLGVPVAGADRLSLRESLIVDDLLMLGQFLRLPGDDHALACLLKSPLLPEPVDEETLFALAHGREGLSLWQRLQDDGTQARNVAALHHWMAEAGPLGPHDFFALVVQQQRRAILARLGSEADDASAAFLDLAMDYEHQHGLSLTGFLDWFVEGETTIARQMESGADQVRIMTAHGAKGLEAPIVILADAADARDAQDKGSVVQVPGRVRGETLPLFAPKMGVKPKALEGWRDTSKDRNREERMRLLYVAMTRAADELYICGSAGSREVPQESWYRLVEAGLAAKAGHEPPREDSRMGFDEPIRCWGEVPVPVLQQALAAEDFSLPDWARPTVPPGGAFNLPAVLRAPALGLGDDQLVDRASARRGVAWHRLLELLGDMPAAERAGAAGRRATRLGLTAQDAAQALAILSHPDLEAAFGPESVGEVAIRGYLDSGELVSGRIDRLAQQDGTTTLVDFKTDRVPPRHIDAQHAYARQLGRYARLLQDADPGQSIRAALLWTQTGEFTWLSPELLSQAFEQAAAATP